MIGFLKLFNPGEHFLFFSCTVCILGVLLLSYLNVTMQVSLIGTSAWPVLTSSLKWSALFTESEDLSGQTTNEVSMAQYLIL